MANIHDINARKPPVCYSLHITHHWNGSVEMAVAGIAENPTRRDKEAVLAAVKTAVEWLEADLEDGE